MAAQRLAMAARQALKVTAAVGAVYLVSPQVPCAAAAGSRAPDTPSWKEDVTGRYEDRLRRHAAPEKLFEYFSSVHDGKSGESFMTPADLLRALAPYNPALPHGQQMLGTNNPMMDPKIPSQPPVPTEYAQALASVVVGGAEAAAAARRALTLRMGGAVSASQHVTALSAMEPPVTPAAFQAAAQKVLPGAQWVQASLAPPPKGSAAAAFAALVDTDGDGLIHFGEFMLFLTFLALPRSHLRLAFRLLDGDDSGSLEGDEFAAMVGVAGGDTPAGRQVRDVDLLGRPRGRLASVFMPAGATGAGTAADPRRLPLPAFATFIESLHAAVHHLEFEAYGGGDEGLTPTQFALLVVGNAPPHLQATLAARLHERQAALGGLGNITLPQLHAYHMLLEELPALQAGMGMVGPVTALRGGGASRTGLSKQQFAKVAGVVLSEAQARIEGRVASPGSAKDAPLSPAAVAVLFALFDADGDGQLSVGEVTTAMAQHASRGLHTMRSGEALAAGAGSFISCIKQAFGGEER